MRNRVFIGIDLGTTNVKVGAYTEELKRVAGAETTVGFSVHGNGIAEQDPQAFVAATLSLLRQIAPSVVDAGEVAGICCSGQMGGALGVDRDGYAITPWYPSALDQRIGEYHQLMHEDFEAEQMEIGGAVPYMAPRIAWWRDTKPDLYARIARAVMLNGYVAGRLTDAGAADLWIDPSFLTWTGLADTRNRRWSHTLSERWGVPKGLLPNIVAATEVTGSLSPRASQETDLPAGVPVVAGCGDDIATFLGTGLSVPGRATEVAATFPSLGVCVDEFLIDRDSGRLQTLPSPLDDSLWYLHFFVNGGGVTHRWVAELLAGGAVDAADAFAVLEREAVHAHERPTGILFVPHLGGQSCPDYPDVRGAFVGLRWDHTRADLYRAVLESFAYEYSDTVDAISRHIPGFELRQIRIVGGGARSDLWNRIKADVLGVPCLRLDVADPATLGGAAVAAIAAGQLNGAADIEQLLAADGTIIDPQEHRHRAYADRILAYREVLSALRPAFSKLDALSEEEDHG